MGNIHYSRLRRNTAKRLFLRVLKIRASLAHQFYNAVTNLETLILKVIGKAEGYENTIENCNNGSVNRVDVIINTVRDTNNRQ